LIAGERGLLQKGTFPDAQLTDTTAAIRVGADKTVGRQDRPCQPSCSRVNRRASRGR
jgi:hypothetical protein